jgi:guanine deaminase
VIGAIRGKLLTPHRGRGEAGSSLRYLSDALITFTEAGKIVSVEPWDRAAYRGPVHDLRRCVLLPGFVDAHVHFPQTRIIGSASGPLLRWLEATVFPEEARFHDETYARRVARDFVARLRAVGTTTAVAFSSSSPSATHVMFEEAAASGLRITAGLTLMDQRCPEELRVPRDVAMRACEELASRWHGAGDGRLRFAMTPRFALSCSRGLMEDAARLATARELLIQTHVSENSHEGEETLREHPFAEDYLDVYDQTGLLGPRTLLAHAIHLTTSEWDRMAARGASVAHCPDSNFFLGSGRMRLDAARSRGIPVALGSDVAAGRSFDMRRAMASAYDNALCADQSVTPAELLTMATLGGAEAIGLGDITGSLEPGKDLDMVAIRLPEHVDAEPDVLAHVVFASDGAPVERVFVRGVSLLDPR